MTYKFKRTFYARITNSKIPKKLKKKFSTRDYSKIVSNST